MTELEKLDAGLEYDFWDKDVNSRKLCAIKVCEKLNAIPQTKEAERYEVIKELFSDTGVFAGSAGICEIIVYHTPRWYYISDEGIK